MGTETQSVLASKERKVKITLQIQRFNPEVDTEPYFQAYDIEAEPTDRVLDALMWVKDKVDGTLAFRRSCAHGVCGSDGMIINGQERLGCKTLVKDVAQRDGATVTIEPLKHLPLLRDLIVGQDEFFARWRSVKPYLIVDQAITDQAINEETVEAKERIQSQEERAAFDDPTITSTASGRNQSPRSNEPPTTGRRREND